MLSWVVITLIDKCHISVAEGACSLNFSIMSCVETAAMAANFGGSVVVVLLAIKL